MHHKPFGGRVLPGPAVGGAYSALADPLAGLRAWGPREGEEKDGTRNGKEKRYGRERK